MFNLSCIHQAIFKKNWISCPGEVDMVVATGGQGPTPWRAPRPQTQLPSQAQPPLQPGWPGQSTSVSGNPNLLFSFNGLGDMYHCFCAGSHRPCRQFSTSRPSLLWRFGWAPFNSKVVDGVWALDNCQYHAHHATLSITNKQTNKQASNLLGIWPYIKLLNTCFVVCFYILRVNLW